MNDQSETIIELLSQTNALLRELCDSLDGIATDIFDMKMKIEALEETAQSIQGDRFDSLKDVVDALGAIDSSVNSVDITLMSKG